MEKLFISMLIGLAAGVVDILPMVAQRMDKKATVSAFLQYFFVSVIIVNIDLPGVAWYLEGSIIAFALSLPILFIVSGVDKKAIPIIASMSIILGSLISVTGHFFA